MAYTISFSEYPVGTKNPKFTVMDNVVTTIGQIVRDDSQPKSPAISANSSYSGPVFIYFEKPVEAVSLLAGYFNNLASTRIEFRDTAGRLIKAVLNNTTGVTPFSLQHSTGISSVAVINESFDESGFSVDTLVFSSALQALAAPKVSREVVAVDVDRVFGPVEGLQVLSHLGGVGNLDPEDFITMSVSADTTAYVRVFLNADPTKARELTVDLKAGTNNLRISAHEAYGALEAYTIVVKIADFLDINDKFINDIIANISVGLFDANALQFELFFKYISNNVNSVDDAVALLRKIAKYSTYSGIAIDISKRIDNVQAANDFNRQLVIESLDFALLMSATCGSTAVVSRLAGPIVGTIFGSAVNIVYTYKLSDYVKKQIGLIYDNDSFVDMPAPQFMALAQEQLPDFSDLIFDETFYMVAHADAAEAVASGAAVSGFAFYMTTGLQRGDAINTSGRVVAPDELVEGVRIVQPALLIDSQLGTRALGTRAGDLLSQGEVALAAFINDEVRTTDTELALNTVLSALANRIAQDWMLNFQGSIDLARSEEGSANWVELLSQNKSYQTILEGLAFGAGVSLTSTRAIGSWNAGATPRDVYASLATSINNSQLLVGLDSHSIGLAQVGGLWILLISSQKLANDGIANDASVGRLVGKYSSNQIFGANSAEIILGNEGADQLDGRGGNDVIEGKAGNDTLIGGLGNDTVDGGSGTDTAQLEGAFASYTISYSSIFQQHTIAGLASGTDTYTNVEFFQFADVLRSASDLTPVTPSTPSSPADDFVVLQPSTPAVAGAGVGNDIYLLSGSMIPAGKAITISDSIGANTLQLVPGLSVASSQVSATALKLNLSNGASLTILGADRFSYDMGGNLSAGLNPPDLTYSQFVQNNLGITIPTSGVVNGSALSVGSGPAASLLASTASGNDFIVAQVASPAIIGGGVGNDTYLLAPGLLPAGTNLTISDAQGTNSIQLASGLQIASAQVGATALKLNLAGGASITVLGADRFTFEAGGNTTAGIDQPDLSYSQFVQSVLGVSVPTTGLITSGAVTIGGSTIGVTGNQVVNATAAAEVFSFNVASALADAAGTNTQATISGFSTANDRLLIDLITANSSLTRLDQLSGVQGVSVETNPFTAATLINFGSDANGGELVVLTLVGVSDPAAVQIQVV